MRYTAWALLFALLATGGCTKVATGTGSGNSWTQHGHLRLSSLSEPDTLNTELSSAQIVTDLSMFWAGYLFNWSDKDQLYPELAVEEPTLANGGISADQKTITYKLRKGVKWHDGAPFGADDVIFTWHAIMNSKNNIASRAGYEFIDSIDKVDDATIRVHLKTRWSPFVNTFFTMSGTTMAILPAHLLAQLPDMNRAPFNHAPIGTGPFKVAEWKRGSYVRFIANPDYWRGPPKLKQIDYMIVPSENTILTQIKTHELDMFYNASSALYPQLQNVPGTHLYLTPFTQYSQLNINTARPIMRERAVRQALAHAFDRKRVIADIAHGVPIPGDTDQPPFSWAYNPNVRKYPFSLEKARALLESAGWKVGADGLRVKDGRRLQLEYSTASGSAVGTALGVLLQSEWHAIGVDLVIKNYAPSLLLGNYADGGIVQTGKFDMSAQSWVGGTDPDDSPLFLCNQIPPGGQNTYHYCNPELDRQEAIALTHSDRATRKKAYAAIQQLLADDVPLIIAYYSRRMELVNTDLKNYKPTDAVTMFWNSWEYEI